MTKKYDIESLISALEQALEQHPQMKQDTQVVYSDLDPKKGASVILSRPVGLVTISVDQENTADGYHIFMDPASDAAYSAVLGILVHELATNLGVASSVAGVCAFVPTEDGKVNIIYDAQKVYDAYQSLFTAQASEEDEMAGAIVASAQQDR